MINNQSLIDDVVLKLKEGADDLDAFMFLKETGVNEDDCKEILATAKAQLLEASIPFLSKKNKTIFAVSVLSTLVLVVVNLFVIPNPSFIEFQFLLCLLGSIALALCCYFLISYYKTWDVAFLKKHGDVKISFEFLPIFIVPAILFYFIISWRFSALANQSLARDMIKAKGTIISGFSVASRRGDFATQVTVKFTSREGEEIVATEDIGTYAFKQFYKGQLVDLVYSKANPANIDLLTTETDIRELTKSGDRDIFPSDLIHLMNLSTDSIEENLDKVTYGWELNNADTSWINSRKHLNLKVNGNRAALITKSDYWVTFPKRLIELDFKPSESNSTTPFSLKPLLFENNLYEASIQLRSIGDGEICVIVIIKK